MAKYNSNIKKYIEIFKPQNIEKGELVDLIVKSFPLPIGIELRRLFAVAKEDSTKRLHQLLKTIERIMQFTSFVMLSQLLEETISGRCELNDNFKDEFGRRFCALTIGDFAWLIRGIGKIFVDNDIDTFMPEMINKFSKRFCKNIDFWAQERNDIAHYKINLTEEETEKRCFKYEKCLIELLVDISFFSKYYLVTIQNILVLKNKRQTAIYNHQIKTLKPISTNAVEEVGCQTFSNNQSVLLIKDLEDPATDYLNLSPLIIDTHNEFFDSEEKINNLKKDVFLYTYYNNEQLHYVGSETTDKSDFRKLSNYNQLQKEFKEYFDNFTNN